MKKITLLLLAVVTFAFSAAVIVSQPTYASSKSDVQQGVNAVGTGSGQDLAGIIRGIVDIFSGIIGTIAVIMIIYGGFRYVTSGGDSGQVTAAKNTIIYAAIGLIIVAIAQVIVKFILTSVKA